MYSVNPNVSPIDDTYHKSELDELKKDKDFIKKLEETQAPIEYIDSLESDYFVV
jgi:hypothetical protein